MSGEDTWKMDELYEHLASYQGADEQKATKKLSKNALKKLSKNKGKKEKKEKPQWGAPKEKKKKAPPKAEESYVEKTPKGQKKILSEEMAATYNPVAVESAWQDWWEESGFYSCKPEDVDPEKEKFVMVIPPPNVTGTLHLGHALTAAVEDCLTRWHRMKGHPSLYVPGTDHAGIATQTVVEKQIKKTMNLTRHDLGREKFVAKVWEWVEEYGGRITTQLRCLGSSVDWSRERFTMDDMLSKAVVEAFNRFNEAGILYRSNRLVNWSCALHSAISDVEVEYLELDKPSFISVPGHTKKDKYKFGTLTHFSYQVDGSDEKITVATTRLETMLGDTAVAVHPEDPRYTHLHGKFLKHPFNDRKIPIITDPVLVDMEFGTGAVKITPAHDPNDYECGKRHNLEFITVIDTNGAINVQGGEKFEGMMRYDARIAVAEELKALGLYVDETPNKMRLGLCQRSGDVLEPLIAPQWYVSCKNMAERAANAARTGELKIIPEEHEKTWYHWLDNIQDWCISRQLWWGHQIPAWFAQKKSEKLDKNDMTNNERWVVARNEEEAYVKAIEMLKVDRSELLLERDEDVLDTWFSSGLFPFSVFGWPEETDDFKAFYPTSILETGLDILFFWVARMVMMGLQLTDKLPFHTVYLHAMVRDKDGRKMSKSLGNVIDPLEVINGCSLQSLLDKLDAGNLPEKEVKKAKADQTKEFPDGLPQCGSDALRFGLLGYTVQGRDVNLDIKRVVGFRQFCNKLWNATRFALQYVSDFKPTATLIDDLVSSGKMAPRDKFMVSRIMGAAENINGLIEAYKFGDAQMAIYQYWLNDLCDVYIELIKPVVNDKSEANASSRWAAQATLWLALESGLRFLHPMMPFVSEELWQRLPGRGTLGESEPKSIMLATYPECIPSYRDEEIETAMETTKGIIGACRSLRSSYNIANKVLTKFYLNVNTEAVPLDNIIVDDIKTLGKAENVTINASEIPKSVGIVVIDEATTLYMDLAGMVDFDAELKKLEKSLKKETPILENLLKKMEAPGYESGTTAEFRASNDEKRAALQKKIDDIKAAIDNFKQLAAAESK